MGLRSDITEDIQNAFDTDLADAVKVLDLVYKLSQYDPETGIVTPTDTEYATRGVVDYVLEDMIDGEVVLRGDVSILILQGELAITPAINNHIEQGGNSYEIYAMSSDPADVQWTLLARQI